MTILYLFDFFFFVEWYTIDNEFALLADSTQISEINVFVFCALCAFFAPFAVKFFGNSCFIF